MSAQRLILACLFIMISLPCSAALILSVDADNANPVIDSFVSANPGDTVTVDIVLELTGATTLSSYSVSLPYDTTELTFISGVETPPAPLGSLVGLTATGGMINGIEAATLGDGPSAPFAMTIATLTFSAVTPIGDTTDIDLFLFESALLNGFFDNDGTRLDPTFNHGSIVAAVPEPSSLGIFGVVAVGIALRRKRRS